MIDVYFLDPAQELNNRADLPEEACVGTLLDVIMGNIPVVGQLKEKGDKAVVTIALKMRETAGNEYQGLSIGDSFTIQLTASQLAHESDSFGTDYDANPGSSNAGGTYHTEETPVDTNSNKEVTQAVAMSSENGEVLAEILEGTKVDGPLKLSVAPVEESQANIVVGEDENSFSVDVHVAGVAADNNVPIKVTLAAYLPTGLNVGNHKLYHVENGQTVEMTRLEEGATPVHNNYTYDPATGNVVLYLKSFSEIALTNGESKWTGGVDYSWYNPTATRLTISSADQLVAFARIVGGMAYTPGGSNEIYPRDSFAGKVVKLTCDIDLGWEGGSKWNGIPLRDEDNLVQLPDGTIADPYFYPIGYYNSEHNFERTGQAIESGFRTFEGVFDGGGHTISNFYQNTWGMKGDNEYYSASLQYYRDGMGLFGRIYGGTVKNLTVDSFSSDGEYNTTGVIAAYADHGATFENIAITNCNPRVYNIGNGGIVGCVGWYNKSVTKTPVTFRYVTVDNTNKISALWGSYDVACGGVVGQYYPTSGQTSAGKPANAGIHFDNCHVAAQLDVYNDVCGNYQYYAYRYAGILLGSVRENETIGGREYPKMDGITATGCTVHFGTWNDYYYCEFEKNGHPSYSGPNDYKFSRVPHSEINFTDDNKNGIIDTDAERASVNGCKHDHTAAEDNKAIYLPFNNLVTGYGWGVTSKGVTDLAGVKILDENLAAHSQINSVEKFVAKDVTSVTCAPITLGTLFQAKAQNDISISGSSVYVSVKGTSASSDVTATLIRDTNDWTKSVLKLSGTGTVLVTIQDYYYCTPTTIELTVNSHPSTQTFIGRVTKADDPNGVGYELWGCNVCHEAIKVAANHELGHHFDENGVCICGATVARIESVEIAHHDFTTNSTNKTLGLVQFEHLREITNGKWELSATRPTYQSGSALQPAVSKTAAGNEKIVQMMRGDVEVGGVVKTVSKIHISFDLSYSMVDMTKNVKEDVFFSFRTIGQEGDSSQQNEVQFWAKMENGVLSVSNQSYGTWYALAASTIYTITVTIDPETGAFDISLNGGTDYDNFKFVEGTMKNKPSDFATVVFRSNSFSFIKDMPGYVAEKYENSSYDANYVKDFENTFRPALNATGSIWLDNLVFSCDTRTVGTEGKTSDCNHTWTAAEIAGETDLYRYTCSECGYYFTGVKLEANGTDRNFASVDFDNPATQTHENLTITSSNNNGHFKPEGSETLVDLNINTNKDYFENGKLDITSNDQFYIAGPSVVVTNLNDPFVALMDGKYVGVNAEGKVVNDMVKAVEMSFKLSYTGDIEKLTSTGLTLVYYQTKEHTSGEKTEIRLYFDKNDANSGVLYLDKNEKVIIEAGKEYTVTLRFELAPTRDGKYIVSFVVKNNESGISSPAYALASDTPFDHLNQVIFGRPEYRVEGLGIYFDDLVVNYEGIALETETFNFTSLSFNSESSRENEDLVITTTSTTGPIKDKDVFAEGKLDITKSDYFYITGTVNEELSALINGEHKIKDAEGKVTETRFATAVEMTFDLSYTGTISNLASKNTTLVYYHTNQTKVVGGTTKTEFRLDFGKDTDSGKAVLSLRGSNNKVVSDAVVIEEGNTYTVTIRMELEPAASGKYIVSFVVKDQNDNVLGGGQIEVTYSFSDMNQFIIGRPEYRNNTKTTVTENGKDKTVYSDPCENFHVYLDNLAFNYEGVNRPY